MKIGFIGLGIMGSRMAQNLLAHGVDLRVANRTVSKADSLLEQGARWIDDPQAWAEVSILFTMLAHPEAVEAAALGPNGFLQHLQAGTLWVDCSTVHPEFSRHMARTAAEHQVRLLDAPVTGTKPQAQQGELVFFVGGAAEDIEQCQPYFNMMGKNVVHVGEQAMGTALKVVINVLLASAMAAFAESVALGKAMGLSEELLHKVLIGGPVGAPFLAAKQAKLVNNDYAADFPLQWMHKDLHMAALAAYTAQVGIPLTQITKEIYQGAIQAGFGAADFSALYKHVVDQNQPA